MTKPAVSFAIPAYNAAATITESIESVLQAAETAKIQIEIVVFDDASTDGTREKVEPFRGSCDLKIRTRRENRGGAATRNAAIDEARYDAIFMLDSDNLLDAESFAALMSCASKQDWQILAFAEIRFFHNEPEHVTHSWIFERRELRLADVLSKYEHPASSGNYLLSRDAWHRAGGYPEFAGSLDAWGFGLRALMKGCTFGVLADTFYLHRQGHASYWVRDDHEARAVAAAQLVVPAIPLLCADDQRYLLTEEGLFGWFQDLPQHPLRLAGDVAPGLVRPDDAQATTHWSTGWAKARRVWTDRPPQETLRLAGQRLREALRNAARP